VNVRLVLVNLGQGSDLHMAQLMPLPLTISCSSKSRLALPSRFTFLVLAHPGCPSQKQVVCVCVCVCVQVTVRVLDHTRPFSERPSSVGIFWPLDQNSLYTRNVTATVSNERLQTTQHNSFAHTHTHTLYPANLLANTEKTKPNQWETTAENLQSKLRLTQLTKFSTTQATTH